MSSAKAKWHPYTVRAQYEGETTESCWFGRDADHAIERSFTGPIALGLHVMKSIEATYEQPEARVERYMSEGQI